MEAEISVDFRQFSFKTENIPSELIIFPSELIYFLFKIAKTKSAWEIQNSLGTWFP